MEVRAVRLNDYIDYLDKKLKENPVVRDGVIEEYCPFPEGVEKIDSFDAVYNNITDLEKFITKGADLVQALVDLKIIDIPGKFPLSLNKKKVQAFEEHIRNNREYFEKNKEKFQQFGIGLFYLIYMMRLFYNNSPLFVSEIIKDSEAYRLLDKKENKFLVADNCFQLEFPYDKLLKISKIFGKDIARKVLEEVGKRQILTDVTFIKPEDIQKGITNHIDLKGFVSLRLFTFETVEEAVKFLAEHNCNVTYIRNSLPIKYDNPAKSISYVLFFINDIPHIHYRKLVKFGVLSGDRFFEIISKLSYEELKELGLTDNEIRNIFKANGRYSLPFIKASLHLGKTLIPVNTADFLNDKEVMENIDKLYIDEEKLMEQLIK
ncbi:hypothetical protein, partial [Desulfurobacterium sp.]|uniref:hypothetical protein n=1 Tax=Desulfurobacterium sp. TaxID=2004706 RepID=UPI002624E5C0